MPEPPAPGGPRTHAALTTFQARTAAGTPYQRPAHVPVCHRVRESVDATPRDQTTPRPRNLQQADNARAAPRNDLTEIAETLKALTSAPRPFPDADAPQRAARTANHRVIT